MSTAPVYRTELSPISFLRRNSYVYPEKTAIVHGGQRITYRQFEERANRLASALVRAGLKKEDRVAFLCPNVPPMLDAHFGVPAAGGVLVSINTRLSSEEIEYILGHSGAAFLFAHEQLYPLVEQLDLNGVHVVRIQDGANADPYEAFLATGAPEAGPDAVEDEEAPVTINYTSGTTGKPKGVVYTHRGAYLNALGEVIEAGLSNDSVFLWTLPMFHCNGWCFTWALTAVGATHVCLPHFEPDRVWDLLEQERVSHFNGAPTVQLMLMNSPKAKRLGRTITVMVAGAPPSPTLLEKMHEFDFRPIHVYGLTETYGPHTICAQHADWRDLPMNDQAKLHARQGQCYAVTDLVRVVDETGCDVPRDGQTIGEVVMRGNNVMKGYFRDPEATAEAFRGGWFHSGDLAVWHPDGNIELRDRQKDIIISGGENISTIEVEQVIVRHPAVLECAVVAVPHDTWGERPKAFVTLRNGNDLSAKELIDFCREHIAHFKCPDAVEFVDLPKTSTGKVQKYVLREKEWQGHDKRIN